MTSLEAFASFARNTLAPATRELERVEQTPSTHFPGVPAGPDELERTRTAFGEAVTQTLRLAEQLYGTAASPLTLLPVLELKEYLEEHECLRRPPRYGIAPGFIVEIKRKIEALLACIPPAPQETTAPARSELAASITPFQVRIEDLLHQIEILDSALAESAQAIGMKRLTEALRASCMALILDLERERVRVSHLTGEQKQMEAWRSLLSETRSGLASLYTEHLRSNAPIKRPTLSALHGSIQLLPIRPANTPTETVAVRLVIDPGASELGQ